VRARMDELRCGWTRPLCKAPELGLGHPRLTGDTADVWAHARRGQNRPRAGRRPPGAWLAVRSDHGRTAAASARPGDDYRSKRSESWASRMTAHPGGPARPAQSATAPSRDPFHERQDGDSRAMIEIAGGVGAPGRARQWVGSCLASESMGSEPDVALIISELVTNSVVHAHVDSAQMLRLTLARLKDCLRIGVTDNGSETLPHLREANDGKAGGAGLRIVDCLCLSWGVIRSATGSTEVWCDVPLSH
jgi:anti-sigma regulatory factor (Ser/Thr protein kinase)